MDEALSNYLFRCDVSPHVGTGHFRRCLVLARELKDLGAGVFFVCRMTNFEVPQEFTLLCDDWTTIDWSLSPESDAQEVVKFYKRYQIDITVIDHYRVDVAYQRKLYESGVQWLQFDNCSQQPLWADWVINPRLDAKTCDYSSLRQRDETQFLLGPSYALLRREFSQWHNHTGFNKNVKKILMTFGGGDDKGATVFCLEAIKDIDPAIERVVLATTFNPRLEDIINWKEAHNKVNVKVLIDEKEIGRRMSHMDMAITAGGTTTFEIAAMGLPSLIIQIAENQRGNATAFNYENAALFLGLIENISTAHLEKHVAILVDNPKLRKSMSEKGKALVDCFGAKRVAKILVSHGNKNNFYS